MNIEFYDYRIKDGQDMFEDGEENKLFFENFANIALTKVRAAHSVFVQLKRKKINIS